LTAIDESLVEIAENVHVYYFEDSAKAHYTKPFSDSENELLEPTEHETLWNC
jgi:hypothetical protein